MNTHSVTGTNLVTLLVYLRCKYFLLFNCVFFAFENYTVLHSSFLRYRSKVLSRWLAGLPLQLAHLGSRNPELSTQLIDIIHTAAARANKELLKSLQATSLRIYGKSLFSGIGSH